MENYFLNLLGGTKINTTKAYLVAANMVLVVFAIVFSNAGMLPFKSFGDFAFFAILAIMLAVYRPGWAFLFFIGSLALENINLAPAGIGLSLRPYQFMALVTIIALLVGFSSKRLTFDLPQWKWIDALVIVFALGGFLGVLGASSRGASLKQAIIAATFVAIYFLVRIYVQNMHDLKRIVPFFLSSSFVVALYGMLQNIRFTRGFNAFEVMPGRPNATFTEADWFGIFLVFLLACVFSLIYYVNKNYHYNKTGAINQFLMLQIFNYVLLALILIVLFLTVSRSAWLGAVIITLGFLKAVTLNNARPENESGFKNKLFAIYKKLNWQGFFCILFKLSIAGACSIAIVYVFHLTTFQLFNRAQSTGGLQKITIACMPTDSCSQQTDCISSLNIHPIAVIQNTNELSQYGCRHINLEDIEKEKAAGNIVEEVYQPDPNIGIRSKIYHTAIEQIKAHPVFGIGWGSVGSILGKDERGASLNASNIFLETCLGAGLLGILSLVILLGYIFIAAVMQWLNVEDKTVSIFILLALFAIIIPNLFNSGIFLGFVWAYLAIAISLLQKEF